jgi:hypothetical protein
MPLYSNNSSRQMQLSRICHRVHSSNITKPLIISITIHITTRRHPLGLTIQGPSTRPKLILTRRHINKLTITNNLDLTLRGRVHSPLSRTRTRSTSTTVRKGSEITSRISRWTDTTIGSRWRVTSRPWSSQAITTRFRLSLTLISRSIHW